MGQTRTGAIMGTPSYMAPEQAGGGAKELGPAADIYALGAILYECLTGRPPFRAATALDTLMQVVADEPVSPSQLNPQTPKDLETICLKCLEKEPSKRYGTAQAFAEDLRRWLADEPITARPVGRLERGWRWCKRHRVVTGLVAALVLVAAIGAGGFIWVANRPQPPAVSLVNTVDGFRADMSAQQILDRFYKIDPAKRLAFLQKLPLALLKFQPVTKGDVSADVVGPGEVESADNTEIVSPWTDKQKHIAASLRISWLVEESAFVKIGDKLVVLDDAPLRTKLTEQLAGAAQAEAKLLKAVNEKDRTKQFHDSTAKLARIQVEEAEAALKKFSENDAAKKRMLERNVEQAREKQNLAKLQADKEEDQTATAWRQSKESRDQEQAKAQELEALIGRCTLASLRAGLVLYVIPEQSKNGPSLQAPEVGTLVVPGQKLIRVCDRERYQIRANIDEAFISRVRAGQQVTVRVTAMPDRTFEGKVHEVSQTASPRWRNAKVYPVTIALDEKLPDLRPGMSAEVTIMGERRTNVLRVPIESLFGAPEFSNPGRFCFVKTGDGYQEQTVFLAFAGNSMVEVVRGLREGDLVVGSSRELAEGIRKWLNDESLLDAPVLPKKGGPRKLP